MIFTLAMLSALTPAEAMAAEVVVKRQSCRVEQPQQRQQQAREQKQRAKPQGCAVQRQIPPVVDPTPHFFL